jgi:hypothetical protein
VDPNDPEQTAHGIIKHPIGSDGTVNANIDIGTLPIQGEV